MSSESSVIEPPLVYVTTLTWNQKQNTLECLESLGRLSYPRYRILLVDNGSTDGTAAAVAERFPDTEILVNPANLGFAGGFNAGLSYALEHGADDILMLNNDTWVAPDMLDRLMACVDLPAVGMVAPIIYYAADRNRVWSIGGNRHPWTLEMTDKARDQVDRGQWAEPLERDYLVGCALLIRRSMLERIGLFDPGYGLAYYEDVDLSMRARLAGFRLLVVPSARMWHKVSATSGGNDSPQVRYLMARNSVRFFRKYVRGLRWAIVIPYRLGSALKATGRLVFGGKPESARALWRGLRDGLRDAAPRDAGSTCGCAEPSAGTELR